ncbi:MAG: DUF881 domain-containing protein [Chloroflexota bacterium]|nr:DUF881 domain-containing protein [Chloroflexota bacterium]
MSVADAESAVLRAQAHIREQGLHLRGWALGLVCLLLGVLLVIQLRTQRAVRRTPTAVRPAPVAVLSTLVEVNARLHQERATLRSQIAECQQASPQDRLTNLVEELNRLRIVNGLVEVTGPGIEVCIEGSLNPLEMQDLVNELRNAGAEAIALNGERLVVSSVIASRGKTLVVDGQSLTSPYLFQVIGNPQGMEAALTRQGGLLSQMHEGRRITVTPKARIVLPVHTQSLQFRYAEPIETAKTVSVLER